VKIPALFRYASTRMRWAIAAAAAGAAFIALSCTQPAGECGPGGTCPEGQTCHLAYNLCYVPDAPAVSWASPQVDETLTGTTASVSGIIDFGGAFTAEISAGRPDAWQPLSASATGQFSATLTLPTSNGEPQPLRIRVTEPSSSGARVTVLSIYRVVDNVAPALAFSEAAPRPTPTTVRVVASEPMSAGAGLPQAIPIGSGDVAVPGRWNADRTEIRFEGLTHDETYRVDVPAGALADRAGNATASPFSVTFTTGPIAPAPDTTIAIGALDLTDLEASSDAEGAVSVVVGSAQGIVVWGGLDARTGLFRMLSQAVGTGLLRFQTVAAPIGGAWDDGTSRRGSGMMMSRNPGGGEVQSLIYEDAFGSANRGAFVSVSPGGLSYFPDPGTCYPGGPVTLELDPSTGLTLFHIGGHAPVDATLPAPPSWTLYHSESRMEWVSERAGTLFRSPRACACGTGCAPGPAQLVASGAVAGTRLSVADTANDDRAYVYDTASGRALTCLRDCSSGTCTNIGSETLAAAGETSVAGANEGSFILQAERSGAAVILYERDLSQGCGGGPTPAQELGRLTTGSSIRAFRPVMFGRRPGLLYISTAGGPGVLRTFMP